MIKRHKTQLIISSILILLPCIFGIVFYKSLPAEMATYWGINGKADGYSATSYSVFILPLILLLLHWLCLFITAKDPKNKEQGKAFGLIFWIMPSVSIMSNSVIYLAAFEKEINLFILLPLFLGLMFVFIGNYMPKFKQNYTMGIKIKWTLESEANWNATHRFAGKVWVAGGFILMLHALLPEETSFVSMLAVIILLTLLPVIYSAVYRKKHPETKARDIQQKKLPLTATVAIVLIIILACSFLTFTGDVRVEYGEESFKVDCDFWTALEVEYEAIEDLEFRESLERGRRTSGLGSAKLLAGKFKNSEFGYYTLYSYTKNSSAVVIRVGEKNLVINGETQESTKEIYEYILKRLP